MTDPILPWPAWWLLGAAVGWLASGIYHMRRYSAFAAGTKQHQQFAVVATALVRQTIRRLDADEQRRAAADAERELMDLFELDVEIDHEGLAAQAATPPNVDAETSDN